MRNDFICPKCKGYLNVGNRVIFTVKKSKWNGALLLLSPQLGDYAIEHNDLDSFDEGEQFEFHCPICNYDLTVEGADTMAKVLMREEGNGEYFIVFSKIKGEKCTYKLSETRIEKSYGENAGRNIDVLSASFFR